MSPPGPAPRRPLRAAVTALLRVAPALRPAVTKLLWRLVYEAASWRRRDPGAQLMNYGYAELDGPAPVPGADGDRWGRALYAAVASGADLAGADVLEVGCGRGGGAAFVMESLGPRSVTGVDLATTAIRRCRARYGRPGLTFRVGDAERLPFPDGRFDVVISVESTHCYPDVPRFLAEARRVLRPGGRLLLADFRPAETAVAAVAPVAQVAQVAAVAAPAGGGRPAGDVGDLRRQLSAAGYRTLEEQDITAHVLAALAVNTPGVRDRVARRVPAPLRRHALEFSAVEGSGIFTSFAEGRLTYRRWALARD